MKTLIIICILFSYSGIGFGQKIITGKILAKDSMPLQGVTVIIKGTRYSTSTSQDGTFNLTIPDSLQMVIDSIRLEISYVGFSSKEIHIDKNFSEPFVVLLQDSDPNLNEVVDIGYETVAKSAQQQYVSFPWPPPICTGRTVLDRNYFLKASALKNVDTILTTALDQLGYSDKTYFYIPNGFALVTRIEQIYEDGKSFPATDRWNVQTRSMRKMSWSGYLKSLFFSTPGYFRIIVFAITDKATGSSGKKISRQAASNWLSSGMDFLPADIGNKNFTGDYHCTALIYEYEKPESDDAFLITEGAITAEQHLKQSKITDTLKK